MQGTTRLLMKLIFFFLKMLLKRDFFIDRGDHTKKSSKLRSFSKCMCICFGFIYSDEERNLDIGKLCNFSLTSWSLLIA